MNTNQRSIHALIPVLLFVAAFAAPLQIAWAAGETFEPVVFASGGGELSNGTHSISFTVGQVVTGVRSDSVGEFELGFWPILYSPRIPATSVPTAVQFRTELRQNAPNPFNPRTTISFVVGREGHVTLRLFDLHGRQVDRLVDATLAAGEYTHVFRPRDLASGVYLYQLKTPDKTVTRRLVLLK